MILLNTRQIMLPFEMGKSPLFTSHDLRSCVLTSPLIPQPRCLSTDSFVAWIIMWDTFPPLLLFFHFSLVTPGRTCLCYCKPQTQRCCLELTSVSSPVGSFGDCIQIHFIPNQQLLYVGTGPGYCCWNSMLKWLDWSVLCVLDASKSVVGFFQFASGWDDVWALQSVCTYSGHYENRRHVLLSVSDGLLMWSSFRIFQIISLHQKG